MKKRTLKKWIPKDTIYCYCDGKGGYCKFYTVNKYITQEQKDSGNMDYNDGYCKLLNVEIFDMCKACGINRSGWFNFSNYKGLSSYWCKKMRERNKKKKAENNN